MAARKPPKPVPFDLDAVLAEQKARRANKAPFTFTLGNEEYTLPSERDFLAVSALAAGRVYEALEMMLGEDQWEQLKASDAMLTKEALRALLDAYGDHIDGTSTGESSAS